MWTSRNRARYDRSKLRYPSDVTDEEWELIVPLIPPGKSGGGKRTVIMREVVNGLMYVLSTGCQWRAIPTDLPPKSTVYDYFDLWTYDGTLQRIHHALYEQCREQAQREASPTAAIIDSQSVKSAEKDAMGREPIPPNTLAELKHDMERRRLVRSQIRDIEGTRLERRKQAPGDGPHVLVRLLERVIGVGVETADMLVQEVLSRNLRDRRAVARYGGLTGSPDESGKKRREKGLARSGNARVRRGMIQLAWRFLEFQKDSALAKWFRARTENARGSRKKMIVALARKLLIALWRLVQEGVVPDGVILRPAQ